LLALARPDEARAAFARALAIDPRDVGARVGLARTSLELGAAADALASLDLVLARGELSFARHLRAAALRVRLLSVVAALLRPQQPARLWPLAAAAH
jgi:Tfp pilus assembly protein PilF